MHLNAIGHYSYAVVPEMRMWQLSSLYSLLLVFDVHVFVLKRNLLDRQFICRVVCCAALRCAVPYSIEL